MNGKTIGILGGMGPEATLKLFAHIINCTPAQRDQDHLPLVIYNLPSVPDRSKALLEGGEDPTPHLLRGAQFLESAGVDVWGMPCVTAHYFIERVLARISVPFVSIVDAALQHAQGEYPSLRTVGLLATSGTIRTGIFARVFAARGYRVLTPAEQDQNLVMETIYGRRGIKAGFTDEENRGRICLAAENLIACGAELVMAGCTEIPLVLTSDDVDVPVIDTLLVLAQALVRWVQQ